MLFMMFCNLKKECCNCKYWRQIYLEDRSVGKPVGKCNYNPAMPLYTMNNSISGQSLIALRPLELSDSFCSKFEYNKIKYRANIRMNLKNFIFFWRKDMAEKDQKCENCKHFSDSELKCKKDPVAVDKDKNDVCSEWTGRFLFD